MCIRDRVKDVTDDRDLATTQIAARKLLAHRVEVQKGLGRVGVPAVAAVENVPAEDLGRQIRCSRNAVAHDQDLGPERLERPYRVYERLALRDRGCGRGDADHVRGEVASGSLERNAGPGGGLVEECRDPAAVEGRHLADRSSQDALHLVRGPHDQLDLGPGEDVDVDQVAMMPGAWLGAGGGERAGRRGRGRHQLPAAVVSVERTCRAIVTSSSASTSARRTWTISSREVGTFFPTWSARIGSSRWPRSIRTARRIARGRPKSIRASIAARIVRPVQSTSVSYTHLTL